MGAVTPGDPKRPRFHPPCPIGPSHDATAFDSGQPSLDDWLRNTALRAEGRTARTYVVTDGPHAIAGYYCLATGAVRRAEAPGSVRRNAPDPIPVAIIGRLAVSRQHQGFGLGGGMLRDGLLRIAQMSQSIGCAAVVVHAIDQQAADFYARYGFVVFPAGTRTLFLPIGTVVRAV